MSSEDFVRTLFYYQTTKTISQNLLGDGVNSAKIVLSDVTDLSIGTQVYYHKGTTAPTSTVKILDIDTGSKTVAFDNEVAFEDGETITFRAYGTKTIFTAIGLKLEMSSIKIIDQAGVSKTIRNDVSNSTTLELNNTLGIPGGNVVSISGADVDNSAPNTVTSVTPDPTGGTFTSITFVGFIVVTQFPDSDKEINLDLDQLLTTGSAS